MAWWLSEKGSTVVCERESSCCCIGDEDLKRCPRASAGYHISILNIDKPATNATHHPTTDSVVAQQLTVFSETRLLQ
jgi:hypothetical protein